uniref:RING-type domain-containing protein n=1 Tax=Amphimedon queenslandica TaxID=400682 RepID=A0A1X7U4P3_AMPQE
MAAIDSSSQKSSEVMLEKSLLCPKCNGSYTDPRLLSCLHSFCAPCLKSLVNKQASKQAIICPTCSEITTLPKGDGSIISLPCNFRLLSNKEEILLKIMSSTSPSCNSCDDGCSIPVCVKCTIISHRDHAVSEAKPQAVKTKEELTKVMTAVHESKEKLKAVLNTGEIAKEKIRKQKEEVDLLIYQSIASLQKLLEGREKSLIEKSNEVSMAMQARLSHQLDTFKSLMEDMAACQNLSLTAVRDYGDVELLSIARTLQTRATELQEKFSGTSLKLCESPPVNVEMNVSKIASGIASLGKVNGIDPICPEETTAEIPSCIHVAGKEIRVNVISRDSFGMRLNKGGASVTGQITCRGGGEKKPVSATIIDSGNGTYTVSFVPQQYGQQKISILLNGTPIRNSPFNLYISRDYMSTLKAPLFTIPDIPSPYFIAIADNGDVFVTSNTHHCVYVFNSNREYQRAIGSKGKGQLQFQQPAGIAISGNTVYVAENNGNRIHRFTRKGEFIDTFGCEGSGKGQLKYPWGICIDNDGKLYVTEYGNDRIQVFHQNGSHSHFILATINGEHKFKQPEDVAIDSNGHLHITGHSSNNVAVFTLGGIFMNSYPIKHGPCGIAFDPAGYSIISMNAGPSKIGVFDSSYHSVVSTDRNLCSLRGIVVAFDGSIWVAEDGKNRLLIF